MTLTIKGDLTKPLVVDGTKIPKASERLLRKEVIRPNSLTFTEEELAQADKIYDNSDDQAKKFLLLPPEQNRLLGQNIETEDLFKPYEYEPSASYTHVSLLL